MCGAGAALDIPAEHGAPHRPYKVLYASLCADVRPTFVVDITSHVETRLQALLEYRSQYGDNQQVLVSSYLKRTFVNGHLPLRGTMACSLAFVMLNPSCSARSLQLVTLCN